MFQYHNGRLYPDVTPRKLSFKIPDGYWIDTFPEGNSSNCIALLTKDQNVKVEVSVEMSRWKSTEKEAMDEFEGAPPIEISGPNPICVGGFKGHSIYCFSNPSQYEGFHMLPPSICCELLAVKVPAEGNAVKLVCCLCKCHDVTSL